MTDDLGSRMDRIKARRREREPNDRWMLVLGGTLLPLGLAAVVLGWAGVSHTVYLYDQLTYLASGSVVGLALVVIGGFVYFTYWQTVQVREARVRHEESQALLGQVLAALVRVEPVSSLVATPKGNQVHRSTCTAVAGRTDLRPVAVGTDLAPCRLCDPLADSA